MENKNLPTISEITKMELTEREKNNALNVLLNQAPPDTWLKKQDGVWHLPVDKVKYLLTKIFIEWYEEIKNTQIVANSVTVIISLHYLDPVSEKWKKTDGIGAAPINTKKGASAMDWDSIVHDSVHKCAPAAEAFALKNAAKKLGRLFGADLGKDDVFSYDGLIDPDKLKDAKLIEK